MGDRKLSGRESMILHLAADGRTDKQIATDLDLSVGTVRTYWGRIRNKLDASTRAQAVGLHVRSTAPGKADPDLKLTMMSVCEKFHLASWLVDENGGLIEPCNKRGAQMLESLCPKAEPGGKDWLNAVEPGMMEAVHQAIRDSTSNNPGHTKVARAVFLGLKHRGHLLFVPLSDHGRVCCVVFLPD